MLQLARAVRAHVLPQLGLHSGRAHARAGSGGDVTFAIDEEAEAFMERYLAERAPQVAFYSEDRGLVAPARDPEFVLIVDPIDGTRPAMASVKMRMVSARRPRRSSGPSSGRAGEETLDKDGGSERGQAPVENKPRQRRRNSHRARRPGRGARPEPAPTTEVANPPRHPPARIPAASARPGDGVGGEISARSGL